MEMTTQFEMSDLGLLSFYLGIEVVDQQQDSITIKQTSYAKKVLMLFGMSEYNPTKISMDPGVRLHQDKVRQPVDTTECKKVIGCLRYLLHTRPDTAFSVGVDSRFMERPTVMHSKAVKQILRCLREQQKKKLDQGGKDRHLGIILKETNQWLSLIHI